jgi:hypothetical protein
MTVVPTRGGLHCLSDVEFLIAVRDRRNWRERCAEIVRITNDVQKRARERGLECCFEFTLALDRYFRNVKPSIFGYELRCHGKTVWGDPAYLAKIPPFSADDIPKYDAFYLICNRMIEQLDWRVRLGSRDHEEASRLFAYSLVKTYTDLATSLLIFADAYEPSYAARAKQLDSLARFVGDDIPEFGLLLDKIAACTKLKLNPPASLIDPLTQGEAEHRWAELARHLLHTWQWELARLEGGARDNIGQSIRRFVRGAALRKRLVGWGKLVTQALRWGGPSDLLRARWFSGIPRHVMYLEAAAIYAECAGLGQEFSWFSSVQNGMLQPTSHAKSHREERIAVLLDVWRKYFRNL